MEADKPRHLTEDEIQDILSVVPNIKSAAKSVSDYNTVSMKVLLREQLQEIEITPLGISDLKEEIKRQFNESLAMAGTMVGITSSEALGKNITQASLNSFHTSGSAKNVSTGVERITELINATKEPKKPSCSIYFKNPELTYEDVIIKMRPEITEITVKDLVVGIPDIENTADFQEPYWYSYHKALFGTEVTSKDVLRLTLDPNLLFSYKLTMEDICSKIENGQPVTCIYSPLSEGKIDIYPIEKLIVSKLKEIKVDFVSVENAGLIFLSMIVIPALDKLKLSGIAGIKQIYPVEAGVWQIVKEEQTIEGEDDGWFLVLNPIRMKATGITVDKLVKFCQVLEMEVTKIRPNYLAVKAYKSPSKIVSEALEKERKEKRETEISKHSKLIYADSTGANLSELLAHPDVDSTRTYSNNMHEIQETLGIEAARTFIIKELIDVVSGESYINPSHFTLLADFMCSLGKVYGVTSTGISRQPIGALEKASYDKAMKHLKEAAVFGEEKSVSGTSASIYIGKQAEIGTGYSETYIRPEHLKRYNETRDMLNSGAEITLDINAFNDVIDKIDKDTKADVAFLSGAMEEEMFSVGLETEPSMVTKPVIVSPSKIGAVPASSPGIMVKGPTIRSAELEQAAELLAPKIPENVTCGLPSKEPVVTTLEAPVVMKLPPLKPLGERVKSASIKPMKAKIFNLEEFLK